MVTAGAMASTASRAASSSACSTSISSVCSAAFSSAALVESPISDSCSVTPLTVATTMKTIRASSARTSRPDARVGFQPLRTSASTIGLKHTAKTAANVNGSMISLTAASAKNTMMAVDHGADEAPGEHAQTRDPSDEAWHPARAPGRVGSSRPLGRSRSVGSDMELPPAVGLRD